MDEEPTEPVEVARAYYRALDDGDYGLLKRLLGPDFVQERPDRTLSGRERYVEFMRDERPQTDTTHRIDGVYVPAADADPEGGPEVGTADGGSATDVVVRGRLLAAGGEEITGFADVFSFEGEKVARLVTYTD